MSSVDLSVRRGVSQALLKQKTKKQKRKEEEKKKALAE